MSHKPKTHFFGLLAMVSASLVACRIEESPAAAPGPEYSIRENNSRPVFAADVDVSISAVSLKEVPGSAPPQHLTYHIERSRNARGEWRTLYSDVLLPSDRLGSGVQSEFRVSRFEIDDAGRITGFNDRNNAIDTRFPLIPDSLRRKEAVPREEVARVQATLALDGAPSGIGRFLLERQKQRAMLARLEAAGKKIREDGTRIIYELLSPGGALHLTADNALGAIVESERRPSAGPVTRVSYQFAEVSPGQYVRTYTHVEREAFKNMPRLTVDTRLSNVYLGQEAK